MGINLNNIESDGFNKRDIVNEIKGYTTLFYGEPGFIDQPKKKGLLDIYNDEYKFFFESIKINFKNYFKNNLKSFKDIQGFQNPEEHIVARANDKNEIVLLFSNQDIIFLTFNLNSNGNIIKKTYRICIESKFKNPYRYSREDNSSAGLTKNKTKYKNCEIDSIECTENFNASELQEALNEIKNVVEFNKSIINDFEFNLTVEDTEDPDIIIIDRSIEKIIIKLCSKF